MRAVVFLIAAAILLSLASDVSGVFPSRPALGPGDRPLPAAAFVETPRLLPDGQRYAPRPAETIVVILVEFPADTVDVESTAVVDTCAAVTFDADHDTAYYNQKIFTEQAGSGSMDNYWDECSLGNMDISGIVLGPYTMPHSMKYYGWDTPGVLDDGWLDDAGNTDGQICVGGNLSGSCRLIKDAADAADPDINYCAYDTDCDGNVDHVMVVHAGQGQEGAGVDASALWSYYYWGLNFGPYDPPNMMCNPPPANGAWVASGCLVPEYYDDIDKFPLGTFCHEFSHSIGNPDLYDVSPGAANKPDDDDNPVSDWCLMDHGSWCGPTGDAECPSHLTAFNKVGSGWVVVKVVAPTKAKTTYTIYDLEAAAQVPQGAAGQVLKIVNPNGLGDFWFVENRNCRDQNADFDKYDSDWSDWTGSGGPDSLDCGLIITHVFCENLHGMNLSNNGFAGYDYVQNLPACPAGPMPYEIWVEDPGYDDRQAADYGEWWYPWEVKPGAAYADSSADEPHYLWDQVIHPNANCTRTASSIDALGNKVTNVTLEATSDCAAQMTADIFVPGWVEIVSVQEEQHYCTEWSSFHHDVTSAGWGFGGGLPDIDSPFTNRLKLAWSQSVPTTGLSSVVVTNTEVEIGPGDVARGLAITASSNGYVYCHAAEDGRLVWSANLGVTLRSTPVAVDTLYGRGGVAMVLDRVYVAATNARLYYLNLRTGAVEGFWPAPAPNQLETAPRIAMAENPGVPGQFLPLVFVGSTAGNMFALNATGPSVRWQYNVGAGITSPVAMGHPQTGVGQTTRVDAIFFGDALGNIRSLRAFDGAGRWSRAIGGSIVASPAVADSVPQAPGQVQSDETVVAASGVGRVYALDAATGDVLWYYDTGSTNPITSSPAVAVDRAHNWGMIWLESGTGTVHCIHLGASRGSSRLIWSYSTGAGTASSPGVVLPYGMLPLSFDSVGEPIYPPEGATGDPERDGIVYLGCGGGGGGGRFVALDAADGGLVWDYATSTAVAGSPAPTLGRVYLAAASQVYCFVPDDAAGVAGGGAVRGELDLEVGPNPAGASVVIRYGVPADGRMALRVYDVRGRLVRSVLDGAVAAGEHKEVWNGRDDEGRQVAAGIYFIRLDADRLHISKKAALVR